MKIQIKKLGQDLVLRIPASLAAAAGLQEGAEVEVAWVDGQLVLAPFSGAPSLESLLAGVTPENCHPEIIW